MRWRRFLLRSRWQEERAREIDSYLQIETDDNIVRGMSPREAHHAARRKLGNTTLVHEEIYRMNSLGWLDAIWLDLRHAARVLTKNPVFTLVAVLSLAVGIGINSAVFSVVNAVLLRPLPYPEPSRLVRLAGKVTQGDVSIPEFEFWKENSTAFAAIAGYRGGGEARLTLGTGSEWVATLTVTRDFLRTLGVHPAMGREFNAEETHRGGPRAILLSDSLWRRSFGADPGIIGKSVTLNDRSYVVTGVLSSKFWFPQKADALLPLRPTGSLSDRGTNTQVIARLKDGVSLAEAQSRMRSVTEAYLRAFPDSLSGNYQGLAPVPFHRWVAGEVRTNLLLLFGATGLLLLIACSNLATLLLTRLAGRSRELAVRLAMGSGAGRLIRQFLMENLLLCTMGSVAGLVAGYGLLDSLVAAVPFQLPASSPIRLDIQVLGFCLSAGLLTSLIFTIAPILTANRLNLQEALKSSSRGAGSGSIHPRTRSILVVAEVALSTTLLIGAGLLIQSLHKMQEEDLGLAPRDLVTFRTAIAQERHHNAAALARFGDEMLAQLQAIPGVRGVAAVNMLPLTSQSNLPAQREGHAEDSIGGMEIRVISPGYFDLIGTPVRRGRSFTVRDAAGTPPVALVNETLARAWWPQGSGLGDRIVIGQFRGREFPEIRDWPREVVGVVADTKTASLKERVRPTVYIPVGQTSDELARTTGSLAWIVRSSGSERLAAGIRTAVDRIDSRQPIRELQTMDEIVASQTAGSRFNAWLFGLFAGVALLLTALGVYGLLSYFVAQRRQEMGTRMALGATRGDVLRLVLKQGLVLTLIGLSLGVGGALWLSQFLASLLYGVRANDPVSIAAISLVLLAVGFAASYLPAHRATRIDPMVALRYE